MSEIVVTQQLVRELAAQVIRRALHGPGNGETPIIDICRSHPSFMQLPMNDRDNLIDAVYDATETAQITISWNDTIVTVVGADGTRSAAPADEFAPNEDGQRFEPGKRYITENECFVFHCERIVGGIALGIEVRTDGRPGFTSQRAYHSVMPEGCWTELGAAASTAGDET